uniref:Uncharacterized protein n=1 Tax=Parascaris univalens TaxID=6257 RepID=A0A914ZY48_PARUN
MGDIRSMLMRRSNVVRKQRQDVTAVINEGAGANVPTRQLRLMMIREEMSYAIASRTVQAEERKKERLAIAVIRVRRLEWSAQGTRQNQRDIKQEMNLTIIFSSVRLKNLFAFLGAKNGKLWR